MVIATLLEVAGLPDTQPVPLPPAVIITLTWSLLAKVLLVKVELVAFAMFIPFTLHW
jgi:hypothetical protein